MVTILHCIYLVTDLLITLFHSNYLLISDDQIQKALQIKNKQNKLLTS